MPTPQVSTAGTEMKARDTEETCKGKGEGKGKGKRMREKRGGFEVVPGSCYTSRSRPSSAVSARCWQYMRRALR